MKVASAQEVKNTTYLRVVLGLHLESQIIRGRRAVASGMGNSFFEDGFANKCLSSWYGIDQRRGKKSVVFGSISRMNNTKQTCAHVLRSSRWRRNILATDSNAGGHDEETAVCFVYIY